MHRQVNAIAGRLSLRAPQRHSLEILDRITELATLKKGDDPAVALEAIKAAWPSVDDFERQFPSVVGQFKLTHYPERVERDAGLAAPQRSCVAASRRSKISRRLMTNTSAERVRRAATSRSVSTVQT